MSDELEFGPCPGCGEPRGERYGPERLCWECYELQLPPVEGLNGNGHGPKSTQPGERVLLAEAFSEIKTERTRWLWAGRIPLGTASLLVGREKLGKSTLTTELAARLSRGELEGDLEGEPAVTMIVSYEDHAAGTIKPRLLAAGADVARVHRMHAKRGELRDLVSLPDDVEWIGTFARKLHARLLIVDPLSASLNSEVNANRDQDIRRALAPLVQLAEETDLAVLCLAHWNKSQGGDSLSRVLGSRGLTAGVRSVLAFGREPDAEEGSLDRVLAHAACNLAREAPSLACRIEAREVEGDDGDTLPTTKLVIVGESEAHADDLLVTRSNDDRTDSDLAGEWLADELADGEWHESRSIKARAREDGITDKVLRRAREGLGVEARREGFRAMSEWRLPVVPSPTQSGGHDWQGHDWQSPATAGDSGSRDAQSCPVSELGTTDERERAEELVHVLKDTFNAAELSGDEWDEYERTHDVETWGFRP